MTLNCGRYKPATKRNYFINRKLHLLRPAVLHLNPNNVHNFLARSSKNTKDKVKHKKIPCRAGKGFCYHLKKTKRLNIFLVSQLLNVLRFLDLRSPFHRRFCELLTGTQLTHRPCTIKLPFKTLQRSVYIFAFFYRYY